MTQMWRCYQMMEDSCDAGKRKGFWCSKQGMEDDDEGCSDLLGTLSVNEVESCSLGAFI